MPRFGKHLRMTIYDDLFNAAPPPDLLTDAFITPVDLFFTRNHGSIPELDPRSYRLHLAGKVSQPLELSLADLKEQFETVTLTAGLQCAGNRRTELIAYQPIDDQLNWGAEAIGNAEWTGVRLADVLRAAGADERTQHVAFTGLDQIQQTFAYGSSIPLEKALRPEVLLCYAMNGEPLTIVHGAPLRVIAAGYIGARSVKWLGQITVQDTPSDNYFQQVAYKLYPPQGEGLMLGELSVNSVITAPMEGTTVSAGRLTVQGYAMAGGERVVARVDVSADGGGTWQLAELIGEDHRWAWRLWQSDFDLAAGEHQLVVRAWDSAANTQPEEVRHVWNIKGYMNTAWHRVKIHVR